MNRKLRVEELERPELEVFKALPKRPLVLVLDGLRSHHNVGSMFRTADAFAFERLFLCGITPCPPHREIHKTALGATESVNWLYEQNTLDCVKRLREDGFKVYALEQAENSVSLETLEVNPREKYALVVGNEVFGVQQEVIDACNAVVEIPQEGTKHSLNVSVSAGMLMWHVYAGMLKA
jgi:tRNA G18 (ribose-2'-O)-methylase SpoU